MSDSTIAGLCRRADVIAREKGWLEGPERPYAEVVALIHSELSEALEDWRNHKALDERWVEASGKPCGIQTELADFVIRVCQHVGTHNDGCYIERLDSVFAAGSARPCPESFEQLLADLHLQVSLSYRAHGYAGGTLWVEYLGEALRLVFDFSEENGLSLWDAVHEKEEYNRTRPYRHGGKRI